MATLQQMRYLHGVLIPQFIEAVGLENDKETVLNVKEMFKKYLETRSIASLSDGDMSKFIAAFKMLSAREFHVELTKDFAQLTMREVLNQTNEKYEL